ncbi:Hypothetical protein, putative [Bodo saltans]|uniref:MIF4G domain-containing protein n=1 Tax=Bodo saltans TaxID=75058 RepID=A0A0S4IUF0_BODSA|nr:Hypothetical protein, putative [Bodo saltans]|eukprot:CUG10241.1 Hypothetical protein, putative [Bodo saltans]
MRTFSVAEIMSMRDMYKEPPYPNFSLDEVLRKRAARGTTLTRGEGAWSVSAAKNQDEGIVRMVRCSLNKIAPEKYQEVLKDLSIPSLIESERAMQLVIDIIFKKALQEPGYCEMYARLCFDMSLYEVKLQQQQPSSTAPSPMTQQAGTPMSDGSVRKTTSKFREQIVRSAQKEFQLTDPHIFDSLSGEELDEARASLIKRKKANITFVGQLYVHRVLSPSIMLAIIQTVLRSDRPEEIDIEVLGALLETVGKTLDRDPHRKALDQHFAQLQGLLGASHDANPYPMRIKFKLMNLIDLRKSDWEPRVTRADNQAPTTLQEQEKQHHQQQQQQVATTSAATLKPLGPRSPTVSTPTARRGGSNGGMQRFPSTSQFPDSPQPGPAPPSIATWRHVSAPQRDTPMAYTPGDITQRRGNTDDLPFEKRVKAVLAEWVNERSNEAMPGWRSRFKTTDWDDDEDMCRAIVAEVTREACITTKKDAQREACSFLRVGLAFEPDDSAISQGLVDTLVKAVEEGTKEDVPKFFERFVSILHLVTEKETIVELYCHAAKLVYLVYEAVEDKSEETLELLLEVWRLLPRPGHGGEVLPDNVVHFVVNLRDTDQCDVAAALVVSLQETALLSSTAISAWMGSVSAAQSQKVVEIVKERLKL